MADANAEQFSSILFVGLGMMGRPMSRLLAGNGYHLQVHDVDERRCQEIAQLLEVEACLDLAAFDSRVDLVILMLPSTPIVESVLLGAGSSDEGLLARLAPGAVVLDMGSSVPASTMALAERAAVRGIGFADAPVSGGVARAITGELAIMFGGDETLFSRCQNVLSALGSSIVRTGPVGSGHAMKALNNLLSAMGIVAASEVLCIGTRFGLDPSTMLEVLNNSTGRNQATEVKFPKHILTRTFDSGFALRLMVKDLTTALSMSHDLKASAPMSAACFEAFLGAQAMIGDDAADHTEVARYIERNIGTELIDASTPPTR